MNGVLYLICGSGMYESDGIDIIGYVLDEEAAKAACARLKGNNQIQGNTYTYTEIAQLQGPEG